MFCINSVNRVPTLQSSNLKVTIVQEDLGYYMSVVKYELGSCLRVYPNTKS